MNHWLSRRHPRYVRSLVYMLQASEYNVVDFFKWHERTKDFRHVERRKQLVFTPKAIFLLVYGWTVLLATIAVAVLVFLDATTVWHYVISAALLSEAPLIVMVSLLLAVLAVRVIQRPVEALVIARTKRRLTSHPAVKIAIAGSFGKTSMREVLKTVLAEGRSVAAPGGSRNTPLGIARFVQGLKGDEDVLIFELGEYYPGDVRTLARMIKPQWGVITGVNEAHLEKFGALEKTTDTIFELAEEVAAERLYVNAESVFARERMKGNTIAYTRGGAGAWKITSATTNLSGTVFTMTNGTHTFDATSGLLGLHMLGALSVAANIASRLGLTPEQIERGLAKTKPFPHRLEPKSWAEDVTLLDDSYNGNPDGVREVIAFLSSLSGRRFYVTPGLVEAGFRVEEVHKDIGRRLAEAGIEKVALIRTSVAPYIEAGLKEGGFSGELLWFDDMPTCLTALRALTLPGDVVLIQNDWPDQYA